ncbi:MAG: hypothetical protein JJ916_09350 [Phycisphaerales bacterium]|nr:hypothetical protein [Phycisphaerales bacterium]
MLIRSPRTLAVFTGIACAISGASAAPLVFRASGTIEMFSHFSGSEFHPFTGVADNDPVLFHFEFDTDATPSSIDGDWYRYSFDGSSSYVELGTNRAYFETIVLGTGVTSSGYGGITFTGENQGLRFSAGAGLFSYSPLSGEIPTSLDFDEFTSQRDFYADSYSNQFLLPIAFGSLDSASITPTPSSALPIACGALLMTRRRR